jgi:hypothetical protein
LSHAAEMVRWDGVTMTLVKFQAKVMGSEGKSLK